MAADRSCGHAGWFRCGPLTRKAERPIAVRKVVVRKAPYDGVCNRFWTSAEGHSDKRMTFPGDRWRPMTEPMQENREMPKTIKANRLRGSQLTAMAAGGVSLALAIYQAPPSPPLRCGRDMPQSLRRPRNAWGLAGPLWATLTSPYSAQRLQVTTFLLFYPLCFCVQR
jgi:hypothetical protein